MKSGGRLARRIDPKSRYTSSGAHIDSYGHTQLDTYETLVEDEFKQTAVVVASFVYHAANRDSLLARRPISREIVLPTETLDRFAGECEDAPGSRVLIERKGNRSYGGLTSRRSASL